MAISVTPTRGAIGAVVSGLDPDLVDGDAADQLRTAWFQHQVLFFPELGATPEQHLRIASAFGEPEVHGDPSEDHRQTWYVDGHDEIQIIDSKRNPANFWHTDATFRVEPPKAAVLSMQVLPERGGDTMWVDSYGAYEALAPALRQLADGLTAIHGRPGLTELTEHPVVRTHPDTGRRALWVNRGWTTGLADMPSAQAQAVLNLFFDHLEQPERTIRWSWNPGDLAIWDNRCTMHYAIADFGDEYREIHRVILAGDRPV